LSSRVDLPKASICPHIKIASVVGARPNFIKVAALMHAMRCRPAFQVQLIHTGQHYSPEMSASFFEQLGIPEPDVNLGAGGGSQTEQTAEIMKRIEPVFIANTPDVVVVVGDVNSTVAASLVAAKMSIPIAHVEAGLRSFDRAMPEEINRLVTDAISDYFFVTEKSGEENLRREGVDPDRIFFVGNVMIDTLLRFRDKAAESSVLERLGLAPRTYAVVTLHRPSNVDDSMQLAKLIAMLNDLGRELKIVFPVHPRTSERIYAAGLRVDNLLVIPPQSYLDFLRLTSEARLVLTDSGGIQEETTILQVPCLTLRETTERPVTIEHGTNCLVGTNPNAILEAARALLEQPMPSGKIPSLWDGKAAERIVDTLERLASTGWRANSTITRSPKTG
jgi:UDP-N-acetylglucosamine 2-epimerase (non-hydrolysing)